MRSARGLTVWPNAMKALKELGLSELIWALGRPFGVGRIYDWRGRVLVEGEAQVLEKRFGWPGTVLHRHRLLDALAAFLPDDALHVGRRCVGFAQDADGVTVTFADGSTDRGAVLVGADGLNSVVRSALLGSRKPSYCGYTAYRGITPFDLGGDIAYESWGVGQRFGFVPAVGGEIYWWAAVTVPEGLNPAPETYKSELLERYTGWSRRSNVSSPRRRTARSCGTTLRPSGGGRLVVGPRDAAGRRGPPGDAGSGPGGVPGLRGRRRPGPLFAEE